MSIRNLDKMFRPRSVAPSPAAPSAANPTAPPPATGLPTDLKQTVAEFEIDLLNRALEEARFNQRRAAELLALTYHQLRGYLKKYNLLKGSDDAEG